MCNMQAKVHAGLDERLCSEFKSISLIELSHTNVAHEDFQKGGKENLSGVVNLLGGCKTARRLQTCRQLLKMMSMSWKVCFHMAELINNKLIMIVKISSLQREC